MLLVIGLLALILAVLIYPNFAAVLRRIFGNAFGALRHLARFLFLLVVLAAVVWLVGAFFSYAPRVIVWPVTAVVLGFVGLFVTGAIWIKCAEWWEDRKKRPLVVGSLLLFFAVTAGLAWFYALRPLIESIGVENLVITFSIISLMGVAAFALHCLERWQARREVRFSSRFEEQVRQHEHAHTQARSGAEREQRWWSGTRTTREQAARTYLGSSGAGGRTDGER